MSTPSLAVALTDGLVPDPLAYDTGYLDGRAGRRWHPFDVLDADYLYSYSLGYQRGQEQRICDLFVKATNGDQYMGKTTQEMMTKQEKLRIKLGFQCPECYGVRIETRQAHSWLCRDCGCHWSEPEN